MPSRRFYFVGVTTGSSSMQKIFPFWSDALGLDAELTGVDLPLDTPPDRYREWLFDLKNDPRAAGALVTTHKMGLIRAGRDLFHTLDPYAERLSEVACIRRRPDGSLDGSAWDPITSISALKEIVTIDYWRKTGAHLLCYGMGGSGQALALGLFTRWPTELLPEKIVLVARNERRIAEASEALAPYESGGRLELALAPDARSADRLLEALPHGSLVANATGMGKDVPGSPLTDSARFPKGGIAWDFNYRGDLLFLRQAKEQSEMEQLKTHDGWVYFLHGWTEVMAEVFGFPLDEPTFHRMARIAEPFRPPTKK